MTATAVSLPKTAARGQAPRRRKRNGWGNAGLLAPFGIFYVLFLIGPLVYDVVMSFFDTSLALPGLGSFAGLANYRELFADSRFWQAMWHTVLFTLVSTPPLVLLPLFFAIVVNRIKRGQWFFRLAFFLPYILPSAVIALIWTWLYEPGYGLVDGFFHLLGLGAPGWLSSPGVALYSVVIVTTTPTSASAKEAAEVVCAGLGYLAAADATAMSAETQAYCLQMLEQAHSMGTQHCPPGCRPRPQDLLHGGCFPQWCGYAREAMDEEPITDCQPVERRSRSGMPGSGPCRVGSGGRLYASATARQEPRMICTARSARACSCSPVVDLAAAHAACGHRVRGRNPSVTARGPQRRVRLTSGSSSSAGLSVGALDWLLITDDGGCLSARGSYRSW
jgi:hypothetical protein